MPKLETAVFGDHHKLLDSRLCHARYANYAYAAPKPALRAEWEQRVHWLQRRVRIAAGLCPEPPRTPLNARIFGRSKLNGCFIEKVHFESRPGFLVTGNLFRPLRAEGRRPAILSAHGHWTHGRLEHSDLSAIQGRCEMMARLGFVVFSYDMIGYNDSCQLDHRDDMAAGPPERHWSKEALRRSLLYGIGPFGLQLWNSIRTADFLTSLPDVDAGRIGCTGASGGATQTYFLALLDQRIRVAVPVSMMSSHYQGGCTCEEAPLLHLGDLTTVEVVAALAPRPVLLPSVTQDWTNQSPEVDVPAVKRIYGFYNASDRVGSVHFDAPHNYNKDVREHVYAWFLKWLAGDKAVGARVKEGPLTVPDLQQSRVFPDGRPPARFKRGNELLARLMSREAATFKRPPKSLSALRSLKAAWADVYRDVLGTKPVEEPVSVGTPLGGTATVRFKVVGRGIGRYGRSETTPALWIVPTGADKHSPAALVACGNGKKELFNGNRPGPLLHALLNAGVRVLAVDLLGKGETAPMLDAERLDRQDRLFHAFNPSLTALRVQEILTALAALRQHDGVKRPRLLGTGVGAVAALLARPLAGDLEGAVVDLRGCKVEDDAFWMGEMYHPFIRKVGDVRSAVAFGPTSPLVIGGTTPALSAWAKAAYRLQRKSASLRLFSRALRPAEFARGSP